MLTAQLCPAPVHVRRKLPARYARTLRLPRSLSSNRPSSPYSVFANPLPESHLPPRPEVCAALQNTGELVPVQEQLARWSSDPLLAIPARPRSVEQQPINLLAALDQIANGWLPILL